MNQNLRKFVVGVLSLGMLVGALAGCGSKTPATNNDVGTNNSTVKDSGAKDNAVEITYAIWDKNQEPGMQAIADAFMAKNSDIKVKVEVTPWDQYWTKLEAAATGGALPDVFWMHINNFLKYQESGMLLDITDQIKNSGEVDLNNFPKGLVDLYVSQDKHYAIPKDYDTIGLWYNKILFDEAGVGYPDETWNWDTMLDAAKKLTDIDKGIYGFTAPVDMQSGYWNNIYQNGGYVISDDKTKSGYDQLETQEALQWWVDLSTKHKVSPTVQQFADTSYEQYFTSGKAAMAFFGSWMVSSFKANEYVAANCDLAVIPQGKQRATVYNGLGNAASSKTKYPDQCWRFLEFMGTEEAHLLQAKHGSAIPAFKGTEQPWVDFSTEFNLSAYPKMLDYGVIYMNSKTAPKWFEVETNVMTQIFSEQITVEEGCNSLAKEVNALLATE